MSPHLIAICIAPKKDAPTVEVERATLLPGQGIEGDRRCRALQASLFDGGSPPDGGSSPDGGGLPDRGSLLAGEQTVDLSAYSGREQELTLISAEAIDAFNAQNGTHIPYIAFRRNLVTRGIDLNALVGRRFRIGNVECVGLELCEPCSKLARLVDRRVLPDLVHRGGLRAAILSRGRVAPGDPLQVP